MMSETTSCRPAPPPPNLPKTKRDTERGTGMTTARVADTLKATSRSREETNTRSRHALTKTHKGRLFLRRFWTCFCLSVCLQAMEVDPGNWLVNTIQSKAWILYVPLSHVVPVCLFRHPGPVSVREQIKMINEKFAGAAGPQWQEPYPLHCYTLLTVNMLLQSYWGVTTLWCFSLTLSLVPGKRAAKSSWEISSEDQTPTPSAILPRKMHSLTHSHTHTHPRTHAIQHLYVWCGCRMDDLAVDSDEEVDYSKMDQVTATPSIHQGCPRPHAALWRRCCSVIFWTSLFFIFQGNKKGPLGRWDFDTQEEYSDYMNNKEALPKWVFSRRLIRDVFSHLWSRGDIHLNPSDMTHSSSNSLIWICTSVLITPQTKNSYEAPLMAQRNIYTRVWLTSYS